MDDQDRLSRLERLNQLRESGALSDVEYEAEKGHLLSSGGGRNSLWGRRVLFAVVGLGMLVVLILAASTFSFQSRSETTPQSDAEDAIMERPDPTEEATSVAETGERTSESQSGVQSPSSWDGIYEYSEYQGRTAGGTGMVIGYALTISPSGCFLQADGWHTNDKIICSIEDRGSSVDVRFVRHREDGADWKTYKPGNILLTLKREPGGKLLTLWRGYDASETSNAFERVR